MIEQAIADHLRNASSGDVTNSVRQTARDKFRHLAGKVYLGRLPEDAIPLGVAIRVIGGGERYTLDGEYELAQPLVEFLIVGRDVEHGPKVLELKDAIRKIFSGYRGAMGDRHVYGCTLERSASLSPARFGDGSDQWVHAYTLDFRFTTNQEVA